MKELCAAMAKAFPDIEGASKDKNNPHFRSKYADLGNVVDAIKPALVKHGLFWAQNSHEVPGGVCVETIIYHASGESLSCGKLFVPASKNDAQGYGSALTYARRYSLMAAFGVAPEDDDGNAAAKSNRANLADTPVGSVPPPKKRVPLSGPHMTVVALRDKCAEITSEIAAASDTDTLDSYLISVRETLDQVKRDKPEWWDNPDYGLDGKIANAYRRIESEVEVIDYTRAG